MVAVGLAGEIPDPSRHSVVSVVRPVTPVGGQVSPQAELEGPGMSSSDVPKPLHCSKAGPGDTAALGQPVLGSSGAAPLPTGEGAWGDSVWPLLLPHPSLTSHHADNHFVQIVGATL